MKIILIAIIAAIIALLYLSRKNKIKIDPHTIQAILVYIIMWLFVSWKFSNMFELGREPALKIGFVVWTIFYGLTIKAWWALPQANYGIGLQNYVTKTFMRESEDDTAVANELYLPTAQRVIFSPSGKWPWELRIGKPVLLDKNFPVSGKIKVTDNTKTENGGLDYFLEYEVATTPARSKWLLRYFLVDETAAATQYQGIVEPTIREKFANNNGEETRRRVVAFTGELQQSLFEGDSFGNVEKSTGRVVLSRSILIKSIEPTPETQKILALNATTNAVSTATEKLTAKNVSSDVAANLAGGMVGAATVEAINIARSPNDKGGDIIVEVGGRGKKK